MLKSNRKTIIVKQTQQSIDNTIVIMNDNNNDDDSNDNHCNDDEDNDDDDDVMEQLDEEEDDNDINEHSNIGLDDNNTSESESQPMTSSLTTSVTPTVTPTQYNTYSNPDIQYQTSLALKTENGSQSGSVTYRVVQVGTDGHLDGHHVMTTGHTLVAPQTIITPFGGTTGSSGGGNGGDGGVSGGPFYVMMTTPQEIIANTTQTATHSTIGHTRRTKQSHDGTGHYAIGGQRQARDEKRRATHNEVERRRRDKINNWIMKLSKVVPDCQQDHTKQGQSKGGILAKATEYIQELCLENSRLNEILKENEVLSNELDAIRQQFVDTKNENRRLRSLLQRNGISDEILNSNTIS